MNRRPDPYPMWLLRLGTFSFLALVAGLFALMGYDLWRQFRG